MQDVVQVLSKIHSAHRKLLVAQHASLWVCLRKLSGSGSQLVACEAAIVASQSAVKRHDEVGACTLGPERTVPNSRAHHQLAELVWEVAG